MWYNTQMKIPGPASADDVQSQRIYRLLRKAITFGDVEPDDRLRVIDIAGRESASPGAVREALAALATEHLVVPLPQRGFRVAPLSLSDMYDLFTTRADLEGDLAAKSVELGDDSWVASVAAAYDTMSRNSIVKAFDRRAAQDHEAFHRALVAACGSIWSLRLFETVYTASERYRYFAARHLSEKRNPHEEHLEMLTAIQARDSAKVRKLCRGHILRTRDALTQTLPAEAESRVDATE
jgi:GntR family transcriptional regulator, carbon starvation induced regulator